MSEVRAHLSAVRAAARSEAIGHTTARLLAGLLLPVLAAAARPVEGGADAAATEPLCD